MKSTFTLVSFFLLVAAVHGSVLLETRANDQGNNQGKGNDLQNTQGGGNATFSIHPNCTTPAGQPAGSGIQVTPATNQSSNGAPPSQGPSKCFNLTAQQDPNSGNTQPSSILVQFNNTSPTQGSQPPSNQTASPNADNNSSSGDPSHFQFCPSQDGPAPFANGTTVNYQEVPCPNGDDQTNGTPPAGLNGTNQNGSTPPDGTNRTDPKNAGPNGTENGNDA
ncbi:hypothetical protein V8E53_001425 [Lactarius tabidus]